MYQKLWDVLHHQEGNYLLPFYWQHGNHFDTIPQEIERIAQSGCRAMCVESRPHKDFCGETWWRDMDCILSEAKRRNMEVWILDDDHFPTGHAAGHIASYHPDKRRWDIGERHVDVLGPTAESLLLTGETDTTRLLGVFAYPRTKCGESCDSAEYLDFSHAVKDGFCEISLPAGLWRVVFVYRTRELAGNSDYIDLLSEESVRVLIDAVYEPHFAHYSSYFGNTIRGFFSDEPQFGNGWFSAHADDPGIYERRLGLPGMAYPWHPEVMKEMKESLGFDPLAYMAALWFDIGAITPRIRLSYMDAVTRLYRKNFTRQIGDWCKAHGVEYIGHVIEDMNTHKRTGCGTGHYFRALDGQHMSGIDIVLHQLIPGMSDAVHTASTFGNNADPAFFDYTLAKLGASLAHIGVDMKGRAMCEVFGAYGWAENGHDMKWLIDHLLVRGINHFVPHAFSPKFPDPDCPPHFGAAGKDPQYEAFSRLMEYTNKAAHLLYGGQHIADAAILYDAEFEWMYPQEKLLSMQVPAKLLYDQNIDFDFLPIDCITGDPDTRIFPAKATNGRITVGNQSYAILIVPEAPSTPAPLRKALADFEQNGVLVLYLGDTIRTETLCETIRSYMITDIEITGSRQFLRSCHYKDCENDIYMFVNESLTNPAECTVLLNRVQSEHGVQIDLLNDTVSQIHLSEKTMPLTLAPNQSLLFVFGDTESSSFPEPIRWNIAKPADLHFKIELADADDLCRYVLLKEDVPADRLFNITSLSCRPNFSGKIRYTAQMHSKDLPDPRVCAIDLHQVGSSVRLFLNGQDLGVKLTAPFIYDLTTALQDGINELVIEVSNTLANKLCDPLSAFLAIPASGLTELPHFLTKA